jgi:hypothetical protein
MSKNKVKYSVHHLIPTSRGWANIDENKQLLKDTKHVNLHRYFSNSTPAEELFDILATNKKVWSDKFADDILKVLDSNFDNYYKEWTYTDIQWERWQLMELERKFGWHN